MLVSDVIVSWTIKYEIVDTLIPTVYRALLTSAVSGIGHRIGKYKILVK